MSEPTVSASSSRADATLLLEIAGLMVEALNLEVAAADIAPDEPLYGDGLGLDSIDILEIALVVSKHYGLQLKAGDEENHAIFRSLRSLGDHIAAHRTK
jgi:acyl carrier protein